jgi:heme/copper-type cytochrome/quinol oxidase subunit 2
MKEGRLRRFAPLALLMLLVAGILIVPLPAWGAAPQERHITIAARSFAFEPGTLRVNRGDTIVIRLESADVVHGLYVDGYGVAAEAEPGRPGELRFVAEHTGSFRMRCSIACGNLHPFMIGKLVVEPNLMWLRATLATLVTAMGVVVIAGKSRA